MNCDIINNKNCTIVNLETCIVNVLCQLQVKYHVAKLSIKR